MTQRFYILFEYKILVIHIDSKVFNIQVKKFFLGKIEKQFCFCTPIYINDIAKRLNSKSILNGLIFHELT